MPFFFIGPGVALSTLLPLIFVFCPKACSSMDDSHQVALDALRSCPSAQAALGDDIDAAWIGTHMGESSYGPRTGRAEWELDVSGSNGRGTYEFFASKHGGGWQLTRATLWTDEETIRVPQDCGGGVAGAPSGTLGEPGPAGGPRPALGAPPSAASTEPAGGSACDRMAACCGSSAGSDDSMRSICRTVPLVRNGPNGEQTCQQLLTSARQLLALRGGVPPQCQ